MPAGRGALRHSDVIHSAHNLSFSQCKPMILYHGHRSRNVRARRQPLFNRLPSLIQIECNFSCIDNFTKVCKYIFSYKFKTKSKQCANLITNPYIFQWFGTVTCIHFCKSSHAYKVTETKSQANLGLLL